MMKTQNGCGSPQRLGLTLLELVVAMAVIGILLAILLPAVQSSRESARKVACRNHLHQIGVAVQNHEATYRHFPSNGWGYQWVGDSERGYDVRQPGGWIFNLLPFIDAESIRNLEANAATEAERRQLRTKRLSIPIGLFKCPSRPSPPVGPANPMIVPVNADWVPNVAKTDFAINEGDWISDTGPGPESLEQGDDPTYVWEDTRRASGISFQRSRITAGAITNGLSNTLLAGEKYVNRLSYSSHDDPGYDQSMYSGVDLDLNRWTIGTPLQDAASNAERRFGSVHQDGCFFVLCDGSVRQISYRIDIQAYQEMGRRTRRLGQ